MFKKQKDCVEFFDFNSFLLFVELNNRNELGLKYNKVKTVFYSNETMPIFMNFSYVGGEYKKICWEFIRKKDKIIGVSLYLPESENGVVFSSNIIGRCFNLSSVLNFLLDLKQDKYI